VCVYVCVCVCVCFFHVVLNSLNVPFFNRERSKSLEKARFFDWYLGRRGQPAHAVANKSMDGRKVLE
jgi:hypothetical protein